MKLEITEKSFNIEFTEYDLREIEYIYKQLYQESARINGPEIWSEAIIKFLVRQGYEIKEKAPNGRGD